MGDRIDEQTAAAVATELIRVASVAALQMLAIATETAKTQADVMRVDLQYIKDDLKDIKSRLDNKYVSVEVFDPIRRLVYGLVAVTMIAVVGALLTLVLRR